MGVTRVHVTGSVVLALMAADVRAAIEFLPPASYATAANPESLAAGDLDGDGDADLVAACTMSGRVSILLNDGTGAFAPAPGSPLAVALPVSVAIGSLDSSRDAFADLLIACQVYAATDRSVVHTWTGDGTGRFVPSASLTVGPCGSIFRKAVLGDWDLDGLTDAALASGELLRGDGSGRFTVSGRPIPGAMEITAARLDADEIDDLVAVNALASGVSAWRGTGTGTFDPLGAPLLLGPTIETAAAADFDGDGDGDLVVTSFYAQEIRFLENVGPTGFAEVTGARRPVSSPHPRGILTADFDEDGVSDVVVGSNTDSPVTVLRGLGGFSFEEVGGSPLHVATGVSISCAAEDFDGDSHRDLACVDFQGGSIAVFLAPRRPAVPMLRHGALTQRTLAEHPSIFESPGPESLERNRDVFIADLGESRAVRASGDAAPRPDGEPGVLIFYELPDVPDPLALSRSGSDVVLSW